MPVFKPTRLFLLLILAISIILSVAQLSSGSNSSHWIDDDEDENEQATIDEDHRRSLAQKTKYVSYNALKKNSVPCNKRGASYYNCNSRQKANPYKRGCSKITNCYRYTKT